MPYVPSEKPIKVFCEEFLTDPKNGDFDTVGILHAKDEEGKSTAIYRYFKDDGYDWKEIDAVEYIDRKKQTKERMANEVVDQKATAQHCNQIACVAKDVAINGEETTA